MGKQPNDVLVFDRDFATYDVLSRYLAKSNLSTGLVASLNDLYSSLKNNKPHIVVVGERVKDALSVLEMPQFIHIPAVIYSASGEDSEVAVKHHIPHYEKGRVTPVGLCKEVIKEIQGDKR